MWLYALVSVMSGLVRICIPSVPAKSSGWSVLIILKVLHNAIKHYNYPELNIQNQENLRAWDLIQP